MTNPLVSIVVPTYNQELPYLKQCLDSILEQHYDNFEIVVSDNHSTNGVADFLKNNYQHERIRIVKPPQHLPITPHFQWASEQARGEYISFLGSDDWIEPDFIKSLVGLMHPNPTVVMSSCNVKLARQEKLSDFRHLPSGIFPSEKEFETYIRLKKVRGNFTGSLFRAKNYHAVGGVGHGNLQFGADKWFLIQIAAQGDIAYTNDSLAVFRLDNPNRGKRRVAYIEDTIRIYELIKAHFSTKIKHIDAFLSREKRLMAFEFLGILPQNLKANDITESQFDEALGLVKKLSDSRIIHWICDLYKERKGIKMVEMAYFLSLKYTDARNKLAKIWG